MMPFTLLRRAEKAGVMERDFIVWGFVERDMIFSGWGGVRWM